MDDSSSDSPPPELGVTILNQYYVPDVASTGHLLHELANYLSGRNMAVRVITSRPSYGPPDTWQPCPTRELTPQGVRVHRMRTTRLSKNRLLGRLLNSTTFLLPLMVRMLLTSRRRAVYLYTTNPPYLGIVGAFVSLLRRHRYVVLLHDSYPQLAVLVGTIRGGSLIDHTWHALNRFIYRRATRTIVLCKAAKHLVCETYGIDEARVHVISNWADGRALYPCRKSETAFAREHGLVEPFVLLYSGNLGLYYEFNNLLEAARQLRDEPFRLVLVGAGGQGADIKRRIESMDLANTLLLPYQPFDTINDSLNACDASLVTIARGVEGISYPSKLYSSLAIGKPVLAISESDSELREIVEQHEVGRWIEIDDIEVLVREIRGLMADPAACEAMGRRARAVFEADYTIEASGSKYAEVLRPSGDEDVRP